MKNALLAPLALLALVAGVCAVAFVWQPGLASFHDDSVSYLLMAQAFSPWHSATPAVMAAWPNEKYPPLFPVVLALVGADLDWRLAHALVALSFAAAIVFLGAYASRTSGSTACGVAAALLFAALPGVWLNLKGILSEFPFMAVTFGTLAWLAARPPGRPLARRDGIALGILLAAAMLMRTIGFTLAAGVAVAEIASWVRTRDRARLREIVVALVIACGATAAWYVARPSGGEDAYATYGAKVAGADAAWIARLVAANAAAIHDGWLNALVIYWGEPWQAKSVAGAVLGIAGLAAVGWRAARLQADGLYVAFFLAVLLAWPFPGQMYRLALPVFPLMLALAWCGIAVVSRAKWGDRMGWRAPVYSVTFPLAFCVPALFYIAERARLADAPGSQPRMKEIMEYYRIPFRPDAEANAALQLRAFDDMPRIRETTPADARVMAYGPAYIALLASRRGVPLDYPADRADMAAQLRETRADYVYLSRIHPRDSARRLGDPVAPARHLDGLAEALWWRPGPDGAPEAVLFKVHAAAAGGAR